MTTRSGRRYQNSPPPSPPVVIEEIEEESNCSICMDTYRNRSRCYPCSHEYCYDCIVTWAEQRNACPLCNGKIDHIIHTIKSDQEYAIHRIRGMPTNIRDGTQTSNRFPYFHSDSSEVYDLYDLSDMSDMSDLSDMGQPNDDEMDSHSGNSSLLSISSDSTDNSAGTWRTSISISSGPSTPMFGLNISAANRNLFTNTFQIRLGGTQNYSLHFGSAEFRGAHTMPSTHGSTPSSNRGRYPSVEEYVIDSD